MRLTSALVQSALNLCWICGFDSWRLPYPPTYYTCRTHDAGQHPGSPPVFVLNLGTVVAIITFVFEGFLNEPEWNDFSPVDRDRFVLGRDGHHLRRDSRVSQMRFERARCVRADGYGHLATKRLHDCVNTHTSAHTSAHKQTRARIHWRNKNDQKSNV